MVGVVRRVLTVLAVLSLVLSSAAPATAASKQSRTVSERTLSDWLLKRIQIARPLFVRIVGEYDALPTLAHLGPEPLSDEFDPNAFARALRRNMETRARGEVAETRFDWATALLRQRKVNSITRRSAR